MGGRLIERPFQNRAWMGWALACRGGRLYVLYEQGEAMTWRELKDFVETLDEKTLDEDVRVKIPDIQRNSSYYSEVFITKAALWSVYEKAFIHHVTPFLETFGTGWADSGRERPFG